MKKVNLSNLLSKLSLILVLFAPCFLHAADVVIQRVWLKVASTNKYVQVASTGLLQVADQKPALAPLVVQKDSVDASKKALFSRDLNKYIIVRNLQQLDSDNLYNANDSLSKIAAEETTIDPAAFGRQFIFEAEGSGVKIKNASGSLTTYLRVDADGSVRAFKADPAKDNRYAAPISKAEATVFVLEDIPVAAPFNTGDVVAFKFQDGSYLGFDDSGASRLLRPSVLGVFDPHTHFQVANYSDEWKERGYIAFATYGYDVSKDDGTVKNSGPGTITSFDKAGQPTLLRIGAKNDTAVCSLEIDANSTTKNNFSFGFRGKKVCLNPSGNPADPVILKSVDSSTPASDYKFELVVLGVAQKSLEGLGTPNSLDLVRTDLELKFKPAFEVPSKSDADWVGLISIFKNYVISASAISGFTAPEGMPAQSMRDKALSIIAAALPGVPVVVKSTLQDLQAFLIDLPIYLPDPATQPLLLPGITSDSPAGGGRIAFKISDNLYLGRTSDGRIGGLKTSLLDPAVQFFASDYASKNGRIVLSQYADFKNVYSRVYNYVRGYQAADGALSLGYTQTPRGVDFSVTLTPTLALSFSYGGTSIAFSSATLGLSSGVSLKTFSPIILPQTISGPAETSLRVDSMRPMLDSMLSNDLMNWGYWAKKAASTYTASDWDWYVALVYSYFTKAPQLSSEWNKAVWSDRLVSIQAFIPEVLENGTALGTNAEFAQRIHKMLLGMSNIPSSARDSLVKMALIFSSIQVGQKVVLKTSLGTFLSKEIVDGKAVMKASATSAYSPTTQFEIVEFNMTTGAIVLKSNDGLFFARDAANGDLIFKSDRNELSVQYDSVTRKIKLGVGGKFAQIDGISGIIKITADVTWALPLEVQVQANTDWQLLVGLGKDSLEAVIQQKIKPLFTVLTGKSDSDWKYLISVLTAYVQAKLVTPEDYVAWGLQRDSLVKKSLRDDVVSFVTAVSTELQKQAQAAQAPLKESLLGLVAQCVSLLVKLQDVSVYVDPAVALPPIDAVAPQATVALKVGEGLYLVQVDAELKAVKTPPLDPATHILVTAYDQAKSRAIFKVGDKYLDISPSAPYVFVLKDTPRFVAVRRHASIFKKFLFVVGGAVASFDQSKLGAPVTLSIQDFEVIGALSDNQKSFKNVLLSMATAPTIENVVADIQACFDPLFTQLGSFDGDWLYYVQKFDAYLRFVNATIKLSGVQLSGVRGGSPTLKDYAVRVCSSIAGQYSAAPEDARNAALQTLQWLSGGATTSTVSAPDSLFSAGNKVFVQALGQDSVTKQKLVWSAGKLARAQQLPVIDKALHFTVLAYDAAAQSIVLGFDALVFDPATCTFVAKQLKDVQPLLMQSVDVAGATYYYLKNAAGERLAAGGEAVVFNTSGDLFDFTKIADGLLLLDAVAAPANGVNLEQGLAKFVTAFDSTAMDSASLSYVIAQFDEFCAKAATIPAWGTEKSSAGSTFKEYARLLLTVVTKSPGYTGLTAAMNTTITHMLGGPAFSATATAVVDAVKIDTTPPAAGLVQQSSYQGLDGNKGNLTMNLTVLNDALERAHESTDELSNIVRMLGDYLNNATKRFDWYAQGAVFGGAIPRDYAVAMLQRVLDNRWFFTGLTDELVEKVQQCVVSARNQAASYPAQLALLDSYAREIILPEGLTASARLIVLLKNFITEVSAAGTSQVRTQVLKKIELYFDKAMVPALRVPKIDLQKNAWSLLLFGLQVQLLSGEVTSLDSLDEKIAAFDQVLVPRLKLLDADIQLDAISNFLSLVAVIAPVLVRLVPDSKGARFTKFVAIVFTYIDFVVRQNAQDDELSDDQKQLVLTIQGTIHAIKVVLGLEVATSVVVVKSSVAVPAVPAQVVPLQPVDLLPPPVVRRVVPRLNLATASLASEFNTSAPRATSSTSHPRQSVNSGVPPRLQVAPARSLEI